MLGIGDKTALTPAPVESVGRGHKLKGRKESQIIAGDKDAMGNTYEAVEGE